MRKYDNALVSVCFDFTMSLIRFFFFLILFSLFLFFERRLIFFSFGHIDNDFPLEQDKFRPVVSFAGSRRLPPSVFIATVYLAVRVVSFFSYLPQGAPSP